jgi:hypothetical protein
MPFGFKKSHLLKIMNYWPPFFGAGIKVRSISRDFRSIDVELCMRPWNRNYVGTHFGGSLYSMTDPFLMLMLIENLGRDFIVWDKAASIRFRKPGRQRVRAEFRLEIEQIESIRSEAIQRGKTEPLFRIEVKDMDGVVIAEVEKLLYVRHKNSQKPATS